jgi:hypothetical protein
MTALLPQTFILGEAEYDLIVRLCGEGLVEMFNGGLTDRGFMRLFAPSDTQRFAATFRTARRTSAPFVVRATERGPSSAALHLEIFLGPLSASRGGPKRWLGHIQNLNPYAAGPCAGLLDVSSFAMATEVRPQPALRLVALNGAVVMA